MRASFHQKQPNSTGYSLIHTGTVFGGQVSGQLTAKGCIFANNYKGAIYDHSKTGSSFTNCTFSGNMSSDFGGAVRTHNATFTHCIFAGNRALGYRRNDGSWFPGAGGAVSATGTTVFTNCAFNNNWAEFGCAIYYAYPVGSVSVNNCIIWGSGNQIRDEFSDEYTSVFVRYSNVQDSWPGEGNIEADPCFAQPGYWSDPNDPNNPCDLNDPNAIWIDGDYHLKSQASRWDPNTQTWVKDNVTSPCIDAGDPMSPIGLEPFPNGGRVNMGAYGGTAEASKSYFGEPPCETIIAGDINGDCKVNFEDFAIMALHWLEDGSS